MPAHKPLRHPIGSIGVCLWWLAIQARTTGKSRRIAKRLFDAQKLVVLGHPFGTRNRAGLDLSGSRSNRKICDRYILGFARPMRYDGAICGAFGEFNGVQGFAECADLINFDQDRVGDPFPDTTAQAFGICDKQIVANELDRFP